MCVISHYGHVFENRCARFSLFRFRTVVRVLIYLFNIKTVAFAICNAQAADVNGTFAQINRFVKGNLLDCVCLRKKSGGLTCEAWFSVLCKNCYCVGLNFVCLWWCCMFRLCRDINFFYEDLVGMIKHLTVVEFNKFSDCESWVKSDVANK